MIWIEPRSVSLLGTELDDVQSIVVNSLTESLIEERSESGPHAVFADAPALSVEVLIEHRMKKSAGIDGVIHAGGYGTLNFTTAPSHASAHQESYTAEVLIAAVKHTMHGQHGPTRRLVCKAISSDGYTHPIVKQSGASTTP